MTATLDERATLPPPGSEDRDPPGRIRALWPFLALPGTAWMIVLFAVPFYGIAAVAFGGIDPIFGSPTPEWNPYYWDTTTFMATVQDCLNGPLREVFIRTGVYVVSALILCIAIGYPVAYYIARYGGRQRGLLLALVLAPWWINYITRMLAWINLLGQDGYVNRILKTTHLIDQPVDWLNGNAGTVVIALVYGYIPFMIVPLYATLDRIDERQLEASRDLGVGRFGTFLRVTLPLSMQGLITATVITALPMFGDYYTNTLVSGSPNTTMIGNEIELYLLGGTQRAVGASLVLILSALLLVFMAYYLVMTNRASKENR